MVTESVIKLHCRWYYTFVGILHVVTILVSFPAQNGQHGSGHRIEQGLQVDGCGCRLKFLILSTGSVSIMRSIGMPNVFCCSCSMLLPLLPDQTCVIHISSVSQNLSKYMMLQINYMFRITQLQEIVFILFYSILFTTTFSVGIVC